MTIVIVIMFTITIANAQKAVELTYNLNVGDKYEFNTELNQDISFDANGQTMTLEQVMSFQMGTQVISIADGLITQDLKFDKVSMNQQIFGMELNYNSEDESTWTGMGAQIADQFNKIIGVSINFGMDNKGNIVEIDLSELKGVDDLTNNLTSGSNFALYPKGDIKVGETWERNIKPLKDSEMRVFMKYTLLKITKKQVIISLDGTLSGNVVDGTEVKLDGTTGGELIVDRNTGMLVNSTMDIDLTIEIEQQGMKIPANIVSTSATTVVKK
jgi:hypothetical protein